MGLLKDISRREYDVIKLLVTGITTREIAQKLFVEIKTVKFHLTNIYYKCGVKKDREFIAKYYLEIVNEQIAKHNEEATA